VSLMLVLRDGLKADICSRWVKTENGQNFADSIGVQEPPMSLEESVNGLLAQVDSVTKEKTSGTFVSYDGTPIAW